MRKILISLTICLLTSGTGLAHDGSEHVSDLELWVAGIGLVLIIIVTINTLTSKPRQHYDHFEDNKPPPQA